MASRGISCSCSRLMGLDSSIKATLSRLVTSKSTMNVCVRGYTSTMTTFFTAICTNKFCSILGARLPRGELRAAISMLGPGIVMASRDLLRATGRCFSREGVIAFRSLTGSRPSCTGLNRVHDRGVSASPLCIGFASNSANAPGKVIIYREDMVSFVSRFARVFNVSGGSMVTGRTPFSFSISIGSVCSTIGANTALIIIPEEVFSTPTRLVSFVYSHEVAIVV